MNDNLTLEFLLVEDNSTDALLLRDALDEVPTLKFALTEVTRLDAGLKCLDSRQFDAVLLDLGLPDSQGLDTLGEMQLRHPDVPIIVLSGLDDENLAVKAVRDGAQDYLVKGKINGTMIALTIRYAIQRKASEAALLQAQRFAQSTVDALHDNVAVLDKQGIVVAVNEAWRAFAEGGQFVGAAARIGSDYLAICEKGGVDGQAVAAGIRAVMGGEQRLFSLEYDCPSPSQECWFELRVTRFSGTGPLHVVVAHENITQRRQVDDEQRKKEARFRSLIENSWDVIALLGIDGAILYGSESTTRVLGYALDEFVGCNAFEFIHTEDHASVYEGLARSLKHPRVGVPVLARYKFKDGSWRCLECVFTNLLEEPSVGAIVSNYRDVTEQKTAEDRIAASEVRYRRLFESSKDAILILDSETGEILDANPFLAELLGYEIAELKGKSFWEIGLFCDVAANKNVFPAEQVAGYAQQENLSLQTKAGEHIAVEFVSNVYEVDDRKVIQCNIRDVTERTHAELQGARLQAQIEMHRQRIDSIVANIPGIVWEVITNPDTGIQETTFVSDYVETMLGYSVKEWMEVPDFWATLIHPEDREGATREAEEILAIGYGGNESLRWIAKDGRVVWVDTQIAVIHDDEGQPIGQRGVTMEVTERKKAEEALQKAHGELEMRVVERTAELAQANDVLRISEARLLSANQIFTELLSTRVSLEKELVEALQRITEAVQLMLGVERSSIWLFSEQSTVMLCLDLYLSDTRKHSQMSDLHARDFPDYFQAIQTGRTVVASDAHTHPATRGFSSAYLAPLDIKSMLDTGIMIGGRMVGVLCCEQIGKTRYWNAEDQTLASSAAAVCALALESYERARVEIALRQAKEESEVAREAAENARQEAERANQFKSDFLSRMSHELRTPLNAILGFGQILDMGHRLSEIDADAVEHILKSGWHLLGLINEVLDLASIEAGKISLSPEAVPVSGIISEILGIMHPLAEMRNIRIINDIVKHEERYVHADLQRFRQVLLNLFSNAIKYNRELGSVTVSCVVSGTFLRIQVSDTGMGLTGEEIKKLFVPFERLGAANTQIEGTGIGLALCKRLLEAMGGVIGVESVAGEGSAFWIELPMVEAHCNQSEEANQGIMEPGDFNTTTTKITPQTILYIEDNLSNYKVIESILKFDRPEIRLLPAMQGSIGIELAQQHMPDLILLDLHLPDMTGDVVFQHLRANPLTQKIPVVVLSADAMPGQIAKLNADGVEYYLTKPIDLKLFLNVLDAVFQGIDNLKDS